MKKLLAATCLALHFSLAVACAAPAKKSVWEYATVDFSASRGSGASSRKQGAEIFYPSKVVFLEVRNAYKPDYKNYLLNRLGSQGWELVTSPGVSGDTLYIFKRQK